MPAQYLPLALWLEADRMASLRIDEDTFTNEREVVKEERRMRVDNQPYGRLNEIIYDQAFTTHPYKHPTIGSMARSRGGVDRRRARLLRRPTTCRRTRRWCSSATSRRRRRKQLVEQYLGRVPKAERPVPRDIPKEPPQTKERRVTLEQPWPLPAVVVAHHITYDGHPDSYPLHIASKVLSDGQSSRIYQKLVYEQAARGRGVRRRQPDRGSEPVLRGRDRAAGPDAGGGRSTRSSRSSIG